MIQSAPCPVIIPCPAPFPGGPDETAKTLVSMGVGIVVGVLVGICVEPLKLWVNGAWKRYQLRKQIYSHAAWKIEHIKSIIRRVTERGDHVKGRVEIRELDLRSVKHICEQDMSVLYQVREAELFRKCSTLIDRAMQLEVAAEVCLQDVGDAIEKLENELSRDRRTQKRFERARRRVINK